MPDPTIEDDAIHYDAGPSVRRRRALHEDGRVDLWIEPYAGELDVGCRAIDADGRIHSWSGGAARRLPDAMLASVRYRNGLWDAIDVTDEVLGLELAEVLGIRDGDPRALPFETSDEALEIELCGAISAYLGALPDFDWLGALTSGSIDEALLAAAREVRVAQSSMLANPPGAGKA